MDEHVDARHGAKGGVVVSAEPGNRPLGFGLTVRADKDHIRRVASLEGIDSFWTGGHVAAPLPTPEALVTLTALATLTDTPRIGTAVLPLPLYPPVIVAKQVAEIDRLSGGRVTLGVGVGGEYPTEFDACGVPVAGRGQRTDEQIRVLRDLWSGEVVDGTGPSYPFTGVRVSPPPAQRGGPPIIVAGTSSAAMSRAARLGDGWMPYLVSPSRYARTVHEVRDRAARAGRDLTGFSWCQFLFVAVDDDGQRAREQMARVFGRVWSRDLSGIVDRVTAAGTPDEVSTKVRAWIDAGADHLVLHPAGQDVDESVRISERLAAEVIPSIGRAVAGTTSS